MTEMQNWLSSVEDFRQARWQASLEQIKARLTGRSVELLSYEEVRQKLSLEGGVPRGVQDIPLDAIVGSVGRYADFTRSFLPRQDSDQERWTRVDLAVSRSEGVPPIDVYQIGEAYFVLDGNHRVSVARQSGAAHIQANVVQVHSRVSLSPDVKPDDLIIKAEYADFLQRTRLDELVPGADLTVTAPGQYQVLLEHIEIHGATLCESDGDVPDADAVRSWHDEVYAPVVQTVRELGLLRDFPGRTETDLYLWLSEHRSALRQELGWEVTPEVAAINLAEQFGSRPGRFVSRVGQRLLDLAVPDEFESGPRPGEWREDHLSARRNDCLFADVLVSVDGTHAGWHALEHALAMMRCDTARLHGLHVVPPDADKSSASALAVQAEFNRRCESAGVSGSFGIEAGEVARVVCERAWLADLVVLSLSHPPAPQLLTRLASGLRTILRRCPRPVLAAPKDAPMPERALLAYDGSRKADEALFVASYMADQWKMPLCVVTVIEAGRTTANTLERAASALAARGVRATFVRASGPVAEAILKAADDDLSSLIIMGGYGLTPVLEVVLGSAVDQVLRASRRTLLICR